MEPDQIRAARALLNVGQDYVSENTGISKQTLSNIERGANKPSAENLYRLKLFFETRSIELIDGGVRWNRDRAVTFTGSDGFCAFYDLIYENALHNGGDICLYNAVSDYVEKWLGPHLQVQIARMQEIKDKFRFRVILEEGDDAFLGSTYCEYKWFPKDKFNDNHYYVFGDKVGFVTFSDDNVKVLMTDNPGIAETMKHQFDIAWDLVAWDPNDSSS